MTTQGYIVLVSLRPKRSFVNCHLGSTLIDIVSVGLNLFVCSVTNCNVSVLLVSSNDYVSGPECRERLCVYNFFDFVPSILTCRRLSVISRESFVGI